MDPIASLHRTPKAWLVNSALAPHLDAFTAHLRHGRYAATTTKGYIAGIAHFARWMTQRDLPVQLLDERTVEQFLGQHLPGCDCPVPVMRVHGDLRAALGHLLNVLREQGSIAESAPPTGHIAAELRRYDDHMRKARGLTAGTRRSRLRIVQRLLLHKFADRTVVVGELQPEEVRQFIASQLELRGSASNAATLASALRAYFRYRATCGGRVDGLLGVISSPAHWSLASLPRALSGAEVDRLLASFTSSLPSPRRGYAIVRCALDMGLRSSEVAKLELADIDWRAGTVMLKHTKSRRQDILPLPAATGQALVDYVRHERPKTTNPAVFVRRKAPRDQPIGVDAVRRVIRDAYRRIGLTHGRTHALRHTLACRLLDRGSSLKEVADVLRHRSLNTSLIYAKLDNPRLAAVALPWPGSAA
jgi:integrase/recombinase XerC